MSIREEQETVVQWDGEEKSISVWTCMPKVMRLLSRRGYKPHTIRNGKDGLPHSWLYSLPIKAVKFVRPRGPRIAGKPKNLPSGLKKWQMERKTGTITPTKSEGV